MNTVFFMVFSNNGGMHQLILGNLTRTLIVPRMSGLDCPLRNQRKVAIYTLETFY